MSLGKPGKADRAMNPSQENYLSMNHRYTCERWEGDLGQRSHLPAAIIGAGFFDGNTQNNL